MSIVKIAYFGKYSINGAQNKVRDRLEKPMWDKIHAVDKKHQRIYNKVPLRKSAIKRYDPMLLIASDNMEAKIRATHAGDNDYAIRVAGRYQKLKEYHVNKKIKQAALIGAGLLVAGAGVGAYLHHKKDKK